MDPWVLKDGTEVRLGGAVSGDSGYARCIRRVFSLVRAGDIEPTGFGASPSDAALELDAPHLIDSWLKSNFGKMIESAPKVEYPRLPERPLPPDGTLY